MKKILLTALLSLTTALSYGTSSNNNATNYVYNLTGKSIGITIYNSLTNLGYDIILPGVAIGNTVVPQKINMYPLTGSKMKVKPTNSKYKKTIYSDTIKTPGVLDLNDYQITEVKDGNHKKLAFTK